LTIRLGQSCCRVFDVARHTPINSTHCSAFPTLRGVEGPAGPAKVPPGTTEKNWKKREKRAREGCLCPESHFLSENQQDLHAYIWRKRHSWTCCRPSSGHRYAVYSRCAFIQVTESARTTPWGGLESGQHFRRWSTFDTALLGREGQPRGSDGGSIAAARVLWAS